MIRDITIGQYYPVASPIHRLDARVKLAITFIYIVTLFFVDSFIGYFFVMLSLGAVIASSKVPLRFMLRGIKSIMVIIVFTMIINLFTTKGETLLLEIGFLRITWEGVAVALKMSIRLVFLIVGSSVLTLTTTPIHLTDGIESILKPFSKIGVPSHEIAMMMTIALRFIPTLLDETDKIMKAQQARGADFDTGTLKEKAQSLIPILVPLFISAFRRAEELATAMEARCYHGGENRTRMHVVSIGRRDFVAFAVTAVYVCIIFLLRHAAEIVPFWI